MVLGPGRKTRANFIIEIVEAPTVLTSRAPEVILSGGAYAQFAVGRLAFARAVNGARPPAVRIVREVIGK